MQFRLPAISVQPLLLIGGCCKYLAEWETSSYKEEQRLRVKLLLM